MAGRIGQPCFLSRTPRLHVKQRPGGCCLCAHGQCERKAGQGPQAFHASGGQKVNRATRQPALQSSIDAGMAEADPRFVFQRAAIVQSALHVCALR